MSAYPLGAANHPDAPYNEPMRRVEKVEATIQIDFTTYLPEGYSQDELVEAAIRYLAGHDIHKSKLIDVIEA